MSCLCRYCLVANVPMCLWTCRSSNQQVKKSGHSIRPVRSVSPAPTRFLVPSCGGNCPLVSLVLGGWGSIAMRGWDWHLSAHGDTSREALQSTGHWLPCKGCWSQPAPDLRAARSVSGVDFRLHFAAELVAPAGDAAGDAERQLFPRPAPGLLVKKRHFLLATKKKPFHTGPPRVPGQFYPGRCFICLLVAAAPGSFC